MAAAAASAVTAGLLSGPPLVRRGLAQLSERSGDSWATPLGAALAGGFGGVIAVWAANLAGSSWWLPGFLVWAVTLVVSAVCDARTQRVPTPLVRVGASTAAALMVAAGLTTRDWKSLALTVIAVAVAGLLLALCWRFAGAGFGDVRLAAAGGVGLGHTTHRGLVLAVAAFITITVLQAIWTLARTRDHRATFAYGPALTAAFFIAAAA